MVLSPSKLSNMRQAQKPDDELVDISPSDLINDRDVASQNDWLPRKEVIQPHLPVRLPCYDFTPVTSPTFGSFLPCGLDH